MGSAGYKASTRRVIWRRKKPKSEREQDGENAHATAFPERRGPESDQFDRDYATKLAIFIRKFNIIRLTQL